MAGRVALEAMIAAASHVQREYGDHGYSIGLVYGSHGGGGVFEVGHTDGSTFELIADRHGNVYRCCDGDRDDKCRGEGVFDVIRLKYLCPRHATKVGAS